MTPKRRNQLIAVGSAFLAAFGVTIAITLGGSGGTPSATVTIGGPHGTPTQTVEVPKDAVEQAMASDVGDHEGLRSENPPDLPKAQQDAAEAQQEELAASDQLPIITPDAAPQQRGCTTRLVQNFSSRRGVRPRLFVLHYTVSANRAGWDDVNAIVGLFDRPSFAASSNYVIDNEGHCAYIVRESDKAWTQAAANPVSISVEVINTGHESTYAGTDGLAKIALVASDAMKRWEIPLQRGLVVGCVVKRPGIVDHNSLGACGGGHHDITPYSVDQVILAVAKSRMVVKPKPLAPVYSITAWKPGATRHRLARHPDLFVKQFAARGFTRISVVRQKAA
jgi:hypothetical protein